MVERLRAFLDARAPRARTALFLIGCIAFLQSQISFAQTPSIGLVVNGLTSPNNQFFLPFGGTAQVAITSSIPDAVIFFTTNGTDVDFDAPIYDGPFTTTLSMQVQVFATDENFDESTPAILGLVQFVPTCTVTDLTPGGGTVSLNPPGGVYGSNTVITLTANPAPGWTFSSWSGGVSGTNLALNVTVTNNMAIDALFVTPVAMSALPANYGTVAGLPGGVSPGLYAYGTTVNVSALPNPGRYFSRWANTNFGAVNPTTIAVNSTNINCSALFSTLSASNVSLALMASGPGTVSVIPASNYFALISTVSVTATPGPGNVFLGWIGDAVGTNNPLSVMMDASKTITAYFATVSTNAFILTLLASGSGTISNSAPPTSYTNGQTTVLTALPGSGYVFLNWSGSVGGNQNPLTVTVNSNETITANFAVASPPVITSQPQSFTESATYGASFSVAATGQMPLFYQWFQNGAAIPGATGTNYVINALQNTNAGIYTVQVSNATATIVSSNAVLTVQVPYTFVTLAGSSGKSGNVDGVGNAAQFNSPFGITLDGAGNIYVADLANHNIRKILPGGAVITLATLTGAYSAYGVVLDGMNNLYVACQQGLLEVSPTGVVTSFANAGGQGIGIDTFGNFYVASASAVLQKVTPAGVVSILAGVPSGGGGGSLDGTGSGAQFSNPTGVAVDTNGFIYVGDYGNGTIRKVTLGGTVTTLAGLSGNHSSVDGIGSAARFSGPSGVAVDGAGNVYVADLGNNFTIRKVSLTGVVTTLGGLAGNGGSVDGAGSAARFVGPFGVAVDNAGYLYVTDEADGTIRMGVPANSPPKVIVQPQSFTETANYGASFNALAVGQTPIYYQWYQNGVAIPGATNTTYSISALQSNQAGNYTVIASNAVGTATSSNASLTVNLPYTFFTLAGKSGTPGCSDGAGSSALFNGPQGVAVDNTGNVYVADTGNDTIRKISPSGVVTTLAGRATSVGSVDGLGSIASFSSPADLAVDGTGNLYVADAANYRIRKVTPAGMVTTLAGNNSGNETDGSGTNAILSYPVGVTLDGSGNLYVVDYFGNALRKISPAGVVTTVTNLPQNVYNNGSGGPEEVAVDNVGNVYIAEFNNSTILKVTAAGVMTTFAGLTGSTGSKDGTGNAVRFTNPNGVAVDSVGNVYVADTYSYTIRKITPTGVVTTLAGLAGYGACVDGMGTNAEFNQPFGIAVDGAGTLYVAGYRDNTIRIGIPPASPLKIVVQPQSFTESATYSASFNVVATGMTPISYQWYDNGVAIIGATNATYSVASLQLSDAGIYSVVVSNTTAVLTSSNAFLTVNSPYNFTTLAGYASQYGGSSDGQIMPRGLPIRLALRRMPLAIFTSRIRAIRQSVK